MKKAVLVLLKRGKIIIPLIIAISLMFYVYSRIDFNVWIRELKHINPVWLLILIFIGLLQGLVSSKGWQISLSVIDIKLKLNRLFYYYLLGGFVSNFLPGTVGGDAAKFFLTGIDEKKYKESFISLVMQRVLGVLVALSVLFIPVIATTTLINSVILKILIISGCLLLILLIIFSIFSVQFSLFFQKFVHFFRIKSLSRIFDDLVNIFSVYKKHPGKIASMSATSLVFQLLSLLFRYIILLALNINLGFFDFISIVIIVTVIVQIPVSPSGIGIREGSYVYFYSLVGVTTEKALAFSLLEYIPGLLISSSAVLYFIITRALLKYRQKTL